MSSWGVGTPTAAARSSAGQPKGFFGRTKAKGIVGNYTGLEQGV